MLGNIVIRYMKKKDICEECPAANSFKDGKNHKSERTAPIEKAITYHLTQEHIL